MKSGIILWNFEPLYDNGIFELNLLIPASPVQSYLKFSEVRGVSSKRLKFNLPALAPAIETSKNVLEWVDIRLLIILYIFIILIILDIYKYLLIIKYTRHLN